jgi:hypothetical protein
MNSPSQEVDELLVGLANAITENAFDPAAAVQSAFELGFSCGRVDGIDTIRSIIQAGAIDTIRSMIQAGATMTEGPKNQKGSG